MDMKDLGCSKRAEQLTRSYLNRRTASLKIGDQLITKTLTKGLDPCGHPFGPDLWRYAMNPLLSQESLPGSEIVAYADDLTILIAAKT